MITFTYILQVFAIFSFAPAVLGGLLGAIKYGFGGFVWCTIISWIMTMMYCSPYILCVWLILAIFKG